MDRGGGGRAGGGGGGGWGGGSILKMWGGGPFTTAKSGPGVHFQLGKMDRGSIFHGGPFSISRRPRLTWHDVEELAVGEEYHPWLLAVVMLGSLGEAHVRAVHVLSAQGGGRQEKTYNVR